MKQTGGVNMLLIHSLKISIHPFCRLFLCTALFCIFILTVTPLIASTKVSEAADSSNTITWHSWDQSTFELAKKQDKPIFLYLSAVWCMNCHILEHNILENPLVIEFMNKHFISMQVDADESPDIVERYMVRGLPTFSFMMPDGKIIIQGNNIPLNLFKKNMRMVARLYETKREKILSAIARRETTKNTSVLDKEALTTRLVGDVDSILSKDFDEKYGGYGTKEKFPLPYNLKFELLQYYNTGQKDYLNRVTKTLRGIQHGLLDPIEGGFYRYSTSRDWEKPHYEKMLQVNAKIIDIFLDGYQITGDAHFKEAIVKSLNYTDRMLFNSEQGIYFSSQDAEDGTYYKLKKIQRMQRALPSVDQRMFADQNAQMVLTLSKAYYVLQQKKYLTKAINVFEKLKMDFVKKNGLISHTSADKKYFLSDQILIGLSAVRLYELTGNNHYLAFAEELIEKTQDLLWDNDAYGFFSFPPNTTIALHNKKVKSIEGNAYAAELYWRLFHLTGKQSYNKKMKLTLTAFPQVFTGVEYLDDVAIPKLASMVEKSLRHPIEIRIVKGEAQDAINNILLKVLRHYSPMAILEILDHDEDKVRLKTLGYPLKKVNMAYLCVSEICIPASNDKIDQAMETIYQAFKQP